MHFVFTMYVFRQFEQLIPADISLQLGLDAVPNRLQVDIVT